VNKVLLISLAVVLALGVGLIGCTTEPEEPEDGDGGRPLDHFKCYWAEDVAAIPIEEVVYLEDQFGAVNATVAWAGSFCNPVEKLHDGVLTPISNPDHHLTLYTIDYEEEPQMWQVEVDNQFGIQQLNVTGPYWLAVPTQKEGHEPPEGLDHFLLYGVIQPSPSVDEYVDLDDQFGGEQVLVTWPNYFANPVRKTHAGIVTEIENPEAHLVFYAIEGGDFETEVQVVNQFGDQALNVSDPRLLAVPSEKLFAAPMLDHFKCYGAVDERGPIGEVVYLEDQFGAVEAVVEEAGLFCNPVEKWHDEALTPIPNPHHHLTFYHIDYEEEPQTWQVEVDNQFGTQNLTVSGPVALAVPTQKVEPEYHQPPVGLDHFLLYHVIECPYVEVVVDLYDQFGYEPEVGVTAPLFFANPVRKTDDGGIVTEIQNPEAHLVFYGIEGGFFETEVQVVNQFGEQTLDVYAPTLLAVPSEKKSAKPVETTPLDHFKCYAARDVEGVEGPIAIGEVVDLEDQFGAVRAEVKSAELFGNPVEKLHDGVLTRISNPDHHLTLYWIQCEGEPQTWQVEVDNQFGTQQLNVWGPVKLAVPTQKEGHDPPVGLAHFLLYQAIMAEGPSVDAYVGLNDQFVDEEVGVSGPLYFANPVQKTHGGIVTEIENPEAHLVFYLIGGNSFVPGVQVQVVNQFGEQTFNVDSPFFLAVPSEKLYYEPMP